MTTSCLFLAQSMPAKWVNSFQFFISLPFLRLVVASARASLVELILESSWDGVLSDFSTPRLEPAGALLKALPGRVVYDRAGPKWREPIGLCFEMAVFTIVPLVAAKLFTSAAVMMLLSATYFPPT